MLPVQTKRMRRSRTGQGTSTSFRVQGGGADPGGDRAAQPPRGAPRDDGATPRGRCGRPRQAAGAAVQAWILGEPDVARRGTHSGDRELHAGRRPTAERARRGRAVVGQLPDRHRRPVGERQRADVICSLALGRSNRTTWSSVTGVPGQLQPARGATACVGPLRGRVRSSIAARSCRRRRWPRLAVGRVSEERGHDRRRASVDVSGIVSGVGTAGVVGACRRAARGRNQGRRSSGRRAPGRPSRTRGPRLELRPPHADGGGPTEGDREPRDSCVVRGGKGDDHRGRRRCSAPAPRRWTRRRRSGCRPWPSRSGSARSTARRCRPRWAPASSSCSQLPALPPSVAHSAVESPGNQRSCRSTALLACWPIDPQFCEDSVRKAAAATLPGVTRPGRVELGREVLTTSQLAVSSCVTGRQRRAHRAVVGRIGEERLLLGGQVRPDTSPAAGHARVPRVALTKIVDSHVGRRWRRNEPGR